VNENWQLCKKKNLVYTAVGRARLWGDRITIICVPDPFLALEDPSSSAPSSSPSGECHGALHWRVEDLCSYPPKGLPTAQALPVLFANSHSSSMLVQHPCLDMTHIHIKLEVAMCALMLDSQSELKLHAHGIKFMG
jgi:hypothetical protein